MITKLDREAIEYARSVITSNYIWRADDESRPGRRSEVAGVIAATALHAYLWEFVGRHSGDVVVQVNGDRVEVAEAPIHTRISLAVLASADENRLRVDGDLIHVGNAPSVVYRVVGWDDGALLVSKVVPA